MATATGAAATEAPPPPETISTAQSIPLIAPSVNDRYHWLPGRQLRAKVWDKCAKKWLAKYAYWSSDVLLCSSIGVFLPGWGVVCGVGMFVGGEYLPFDKACK